MSQEQNQNSPTTSETPRTGGDLAALQELEGKVASLDEALLRARADLQNVQRRAAQERADAVRYGNADLVKALLPALDDLERALNSLPPGEAGKPLAAGVRLAVENLMSALKAQGVETIEAVDQRFDPQLHNALMQEASDEIPAGTVLRQVARGFRLRDRVIRPAMVIVSRGPAERSSEPVPAGKES